MAHLYRLILGCFLLIAVGTLSVPGYGMPPAMVDSLEQKVEGAQEIQDFPAARRALDQLREVLGTGDQARQLFWEGMLALKTQHRDRGRSRLEQARSLARQTGDRKVLADCIVNLLASGPSSVPPDSVEDAYRQAIALYTQLDDQRGLTKAHYDLGRRFCKRGTADSCQQCLDRAVRHAYRGQLWEELATVLNYHGIHLYNQGLFKESVVYSLQTLQAYEYLDSPSHLARTFNLLGSTLHQLKAHDKALGYLEKGLTIARENDLALLCANIELNLGTVLDAQGRYPNSLAHFEASLERYRALEAPLGQSVCLNNMAQVLGKQGAWDEALARQREALALDRATGDLYGEGISLYNLGELYRQQARYDLARAPYESARSIAQQTGQLELLGQVYSGLSQVCKAQGDFARALRFRELCDSVDALARDPLDLDSARSKVLEYEGAQKDREIGDLQQRTRRWERWGQRTLMGLGGLVLAVLGTLWYLRRRHRERLGQLEGIREELEADNKDLAQDLARREAELAAWKARQEALPVAELLDKVRQNHLWPAYMAEFEHHFPGWVAHFTRRYPALNPNDLRLLSLIRLGLSTPEAATFLNITPAGVKKARQRIRKKMGLPPEQALDQLLLQP